MWVGVGCTGLSAFDEVGGLAEAEGASDTEPAGSADGTPDDAEPADPSEPDPDGDAGAVDSSPGTPGDPSGGWSTGPPADTCAEAMALQPQAPGTYTGSMAGYATDGFSAACVGYGSGGETAFYKVIVPAGATFEATYESLGADAQVFLLTNCNNAGSCLVGADAHAGVAAETISLPNPSAVDQEAYLVIANYEGGDTPAGFQVTISTW